MVKFKNVSHKLTLSKVLCPIHNSLKFVFIENGVGEGLTTMLSVEVEEHPEAILVAVIVYVVEDVGETLTVEPLRPPGSQTIVLGISAVQFKVVD